MIRLVEYSELLTSIDDETIEIPKRFEEGVFKTIDPSDEFLRNWRKFFQANEPLHFEQKAFELVKSLLLNKVGIFSSRRRYLILESSLDDLLEFMRNNYVCETVPDSPTSFLSVQSPAKKKGSFLTVYSTSEEKPMEEKKEQSAVVFISPKNKLPEVLQKLGITYELDLSTNEHLGEYFLAMRKRLTSLFYCSIVDDQDIFFRKQDAIGSTLKTACALVPVFGTLLSLAGIAVVALQDFSIRRKLARISDLAVNYADFPEKIARLMALLRSNAIIQTADLDKGLRKAGVLSEALRKFGALRQLTPSEMLAFNDSKIIEGALLALIETKKVNVVTFPDVNSLQCILVNFLVENTCIRLNFDSPSADSKQTNKGRQSIQYSDVTFDEEMLARNDKLPKTLLRGEDESYDKYYARVNAFLKTLSVPQLKDILVKIDPLAPQYRPTIALLLKRIEKKEKCILI